MQANEGLVLPAWTFGQKVVIKRKYERWPRLGGLRRRSGPLLVTLALISLSLNQTSRARDGGTVPTGGFSRSRVVRSTEEPGPDGSVRFQMPAIFRPGTAISPIRPLRAGDRRTT